MIGDDENVWSNFSEVDPEKVQTTKSRVQLHTDSPPKTMDSPSIWGGIHCFGGGIIGFPPQIGGGIGMELNSGFWDFSFFGIGLGTF